ncbi:hypothetical protein NQ315_010906 [Exocentrus adspersus]|uniref:Dehydrogenase/reductase SDR family member 11 n=1 Tax=Exocentrus adspersus TaxID=1586481 RepID=A0AAV8VNY7_9CUCU|nr:hypothetical protein NQ315_010906 [Exocentrus adspersus]
MQISKSLARRKDRLEDLAVKLCDKKGSLVPLQVDICNEEEILTAFAWIKENLGPINILVNSAGISLRQATVTEGQTDVWEKILQVNVLGLCIATREAVRDMKSNNVDGHIIHINSILGHHVSKYPGMSIYPATKFAVTALAETLRLELDNQKSKIKITVTQIVGKFVVNRKIR